jgi:hypothetical protein
MGVCKTDLTALDAHVALALLAGLPGSEGQASAPWGRAATDATAGLEGTGVASGLCETPDEALTCMIPEPAMTRAAITVRSWRENFGASDPICFPPSDLRL